MRADSEEAQRCTGGEVQREMYMKIINLVFLHFQEAFESRFRAVIWFLSMILYPLLLILFWQGASNKSIGNGWNSATLTSYYLCLTVVASLVISHIEEGMSKVDIKEGLLVMYLLKPISYYWKKFYEELPYRVMQATYGIIFGILLTLLLRKNLFILSSDPLVIFYSISLLVGAIFLSFTMRMVMGILTFWFLDIQGFYEMVYLVEVIFGGFILPIVLLPAFMFRIATLLPFAYEVYFPLVSIQGHIPSQSYMAIFILQWVWVIAGLLVYQLLWMAGVKRFSGAGQ